MLYYHSSSAWWSLSIVNSNKYQISVNDVVVEVLRKKIKHLHLSVHPPDGRVRVSVPLHVDDEALRRVLLSRLPWIERQQARLAGQDIQPAYKYVSGESHFFQGKPYLLEVIPGKAPPRVLLRSGTHLEMHVRPRSTRIERQRLLQSWYRRQLKQAIPGLFSKWEAILGVQAAEWRIRQMKTRWGSCNVQKRRIWLNLELARRSTPCLEYIIVHELMHLIERRHGRRFKELMDRTMPEWRQLRLELNRVPLAHGSRED
jgi:predicted metal-dependent hydrolase